MVLAIALVMQQAPCSISWTKQVAHILMLLLLALDDGWVNPLPVLWELATLSEGREEQGFRKPVSKWCFLKESSTINSRSHYFSLAHTLLCSSVVPSCD
jgi:hypothetical protein